MTDGPLLFARYAFPPNSLGYCGPNDSEAVFGALSAGARRDLASMAPRFEGAWPYLQLIAGCNGIGDPLDRRVVEAYWLGNELLDHVPAAALRLSCDDRFRARTGRRQECLEAAVASGGVAHHSFHVFAVYPWLGLLRDGVRDAPLQVLDRCRIRWGLVEWVGGGQVAVRSRPLLLSSTRLELGPSKREFVNALPGIALKAGDVVSMHWDWICDRLDSHQVRRLSRVTLRNLAAVNALPVPGPAYACDRHGVS